ncbi:hypothetical protein B0T10DRAFT_532572 [Thelonectria olida]|uniref:Uncharacterized protein n=1 Tax=Thelonectria olida TaxID=1576542 RepID=A0A9P9AK87_9HYPO|nr:hypothetical protein B0T10DRAFT_532572 [Thelonectria olida]
MTYLFLYIDASDFEPIVQQLTQAHKLSETASAAEQAGQLERASEYYPRACTVWFLSRYPALISCLKGLQLRGIPIHEEMVPYKHALHPPVVLAMGGLDSWLPELACFTGVLQRCRTGMIIAEVPGTGDSPALADDPLSPDRQWSSLLDWIDDQEAIDSKRVVG